MQQEASPGAGSGARQITAAAGPTRADRVMMQHWATVGWIQTRNRVLTLRRLGDSDASRWQ